MKDPLQTKRTPYEILGIDRDADSDAVFEALKKTMSEGGDMQAAMRASDVLQDPEQRAMVDILHYDPEWVGSLTPSPIADPSILLLSNRAATAKAWERHLFYNFPDLDVTHSLAVLWYWWTTYEEERFSRLMEAAEKQRVNLPDTLSKQTLLAAIRKAEGTRCDPAKGKGCKHADCPWWEDCTSGAPPLQDMWQRVIAYWVMLLNTAEFWNGFAQRYAEVAEKVKAQFMSSLENKLVSSEKQYRKKKAQSLTDQYTELLLDLSTEDKTARIMAEVSIRLKRHNARLCCGALLLQQLQQFNLLSGVRAQVDAAIRGAQPGDWHDQLTSLRQALSPYAKIAELIRTKRPDAALAAIAKLPAKERKTDEVLSLKARALIEKAEQQASMDNIDEALNLWGEALKTATNKDIQMEARDGVVASVNKKAASLQRHRKDDAIALVERALQLVDDERLRLTLGEILVSRGIDRVMEAQKKASDGDMKEAIAECERGLADLERAVKLGSSRAKEQVEKAREVCNQIKKPSKVKQWVEEASKAAEKELWDKAITLLSRAIKEFKEEPPSGLKHSLAVCYTNRAVETTNRAVEMMRKEIEKWEQKVEKEFSRSSSSFECARCRRDQFGHPYESWYEVELPRVGKVTICKKCVGKARRLMQNRPKPDKKVFSMLDAASKDLSQAAKFDPDSKTVRKHLKELNEIRSQLRPRAGGESRAGIDEGDVEELIGALRHRDPQVRRRAAKALVEMAGDAQVQEALMKTLDDPEVRDEILKAMQERL